MAGVIVGLTLPLPSREATPPGLSWRLELVRTPQLVLEIQATLDGAPSGTTELELSDSLERIVAGGEDVEWLEASGADGRPLSVERPEPALWIVRHLERERLSVRYRLPANEHQDSGDLAVNGRPILNEYLFHAFGHLVLVRPAHLRRQSVRASLSWSGVEALGWKAASSFGESSEPIEVLLPLEDVLDSVFLAGEIELVHREVRGKRVLAAVAGDEWRFEPAAFADAVASIAEFQRAFFDDDGDSFFLASLIPVGRTMTARSHRHGMAFTQSFALRVPPRAAMDDDMRGLIAHELFHAWTRRALAPVEPTELPSWFSEGFTQFYAQRLLVRAGEIPASAWLSSLNDTLADYFSSAVRNAPNSAIYAGRLLDNDIFQLPYLRGEIVALLADRAIRRASQDRASLDDLMRAVVREARHEGKRFRAEDLLERIARLAGREYAETIRAIVERGDRPRLDPLLFEPCFELYTGSGGPFDPGFDLESSITDGTVRGVKEGSLAWKSGLRDGWELLSFQVVEGKEGREAIVQAQLEESLYLLHYPPLGECAVEVPQLRLRAGAELEPCAGR
ncbi:MAG TPA: hypothetical protein VMS76_03015 [Planctomycetota bacterium]|nr:hypothetical protein [Planctomycetota bacterium]